MRSVKLAILAVCHLDCRAPLRSGLVLVGILASLFAADRGYAAITLHDALGRLVTGDDIRGYDPVLGNFIEREDVFTNITADDVIHIIGVHVILLEPRDLGFETITNVFDIIAEAQFQHSDYHLWGTNWWGPLVPAGPVNWQFAELFHSIPLILNPGESFTVFSIAHNSLFGEVHGSLVDDVGDLIIGFRFEGTFVSQVEPSPIPEPSGVMLWSVMAAICACWGVGVHSRRRRSARDEQLTGN